MKNFLMLILLLSATVSKGQNISFPDPNFKDFLVNIVTYSSGSAPAVDVNADGEIQQSEAYNYGFLTSNLSIFQHNITDITGIEYFTSISVLIISNTNLTILNLGGLNLSSVYISNNPNLTSANITFPNPLYFTTLSIQSGNLGAWDLGTNYTNLSTITIIGSHLTSINVSGCSGLSLLQLNNNELTSLNLDGLTNLTYINCAQNQLNNLSLTGVATGTPYGYELVCSQNQITSLNLAGSRISNLTCKQNTLLTTIDMSDCQFTTLLDCSYCPLLNSIYMKDGNTIGISNFTSIFCSNLRYVCCDESEEVSLRNYYTSYSMPYVTVDNLCTFVPGGVPGVSYYTISGTVKYDSDDNGCSAADPAPPFTDVEAYNTSTGDHVGTMADANGFYKLYIHSASLWSVYPSLWGTSGYFDVQTSGGSTDITYLNTQPVVNFCLTKRTDTIGIDLEVTVVPKNGVTPGAATSYQVLYRNKGNVIQSGTVQLNFDDTKLDFSSASPAQNLLSTGIISWNFTNLAPFERRSIDVSFSALPAPANNIGDTIIFYGIITPSIGTEATPDDNNFEYKQPITGQYPGNSKICLETTINPLDYNYNDSRYIHYVINFQNQGTETVTNVMIRDTISGKLNIPTLQILKTSHACSYIRNGNFVEFYFPNINLPPASSDDAASRAYLIFKVHTTIYTEAGDSILNRASIYFDHAPPVFSNTARLGVTNTTVVPVILEYFTGRRQGNKHLLNWKANCSTGESRFDIERSLDQTKFISIGHITATSSRCNQDFDFTDNEPANGINYYRLKLTDENGKITYSKVIALLNKKTGFEIISMIPNPVTNETAVLNVTAAQSQQINISITDILGKRVYATSKRITAGSTQIEMNLNKLPNAVYNIQIYTSFGERRTWRFVKQ